MGNDIFRSELIKLRSLIDLIELYDAMSEDSSEKNLRKVDSMYLFGVTSDNENSTFISARKLLDKGLTERVLIDNMPPQNGFSGFSEWSKKLSELYGIHPQGLDIDTSKGYNTLTEAESLVRYSSKENLNSLYLITPPFHLLRAFMTTSSVAIREDPGVNFFAYGGAEQDWNQVMEYHLWVTSRRIDSIKSEIERIKKYQAKGDIESTKKIMDYIVHRK